MTIPLRTRSDLKQAGRNMAVEAVDALATYIGTLTAEQLQDHAHIDAVTARMIGAAENVAVTYREVGIPEAWVNAFLNSFTRTASARLADHSLAARPAAGSA